MSPEPTVSLLGPSSVLPGGPTADASKLRLVGAGILPRSGAGI